jgi:hypothetical protein
MTPHQVFGNWLAATIMRRLYGVSVTDLGPFRAIRRGDLLDPPAERPAADSLRGW